MFFCFSVVFGNVTEPGAGCYIPLARYGIIIDESRNFYDEILSPLSRLALLSIGKIKTSRDTKYIKGGSGLLTHQDSNLDQENQNLLCCHYTMGQNIHDLRIIYYGYKA